MGQKLILEGEEFLACGGDPDESPPARAVAAHRIRPGGRGRKLPLSCMNFYFVKITLTLKQEGRKT